MNALELLKQDHRKVDELFSQFENAEDDKRKERLFEQICQELTIHTYIEEAVLYPALQKREELKDMVLEAIEEHRQVKKLIAESERLIEGSEKLDAKVKVMQEDVEHHVEEEENEMFPKAEQLFSREQLNELGRQLEEAKREFGKQPKTRSTAS
ncbi:MAG TPA: hemerythrin domain-containing protein [Blastocatellia bacterium]|nr:hemerythrin domain-containing protein [Blastocatellia bacterium]